MSVPTPSGGTKPNRKVSTIVLLVVGVLGVFLVGLWLAERLPGMLPSAPSVDEAPRPPGSDPIYGVRPGIQPRYTILSTHEENRKPTKNLPNPVKGTLVRIQVPAGLSREELEDNIRLANKTVFEKKPVDAQIVFAYKEGSDLKGPFTAGRLEFGPNGNWNDAAPNTPLDQFRVTLELDSRYFQAAGASRGAPAGKPKPK